KRLLKYAPKRRRTSRVYETQESRITDPSIKAAVEGDIDARLKKRNSAAEATDYRGRFAHYQREKTLRPIFFCGGARAVLGELPGDSIDCCMTSPPYWGKRVY